MARQKKTNSEISAKSEYQRVTVLLNTKSRTLIKVASAIRRESEYKTYQWLIETYLPSYIKENIPQ